MTQVVIAPRGLGRVTGWHEDSERGRSSIQITWDHLGPEDPRQVMWGSDLADQMIPGIDAFQLYEELRAEDSSRTNDSLCP